MSQIQVEINQRIESFVAEITQLARQTAYEALSTALEHGTAETAELAAISPSAPAFPRHRRGGKRSPEEIAAAADSLLRYIQENPGQRMETIAQAMDVPTKELTLPLKKLFAANKIQAEGRKRATTYFPAAEPRPRKSSKASKTSKTSKASKTRKRSTRRKKRTRA